MHFIFPGSLTGARIACRAWIMKVAPESQTMKSRGDRLIDKKCREKSPETWLPSSEDVRVHDHFHRKGNQNILLCCVPASQAIDRESCVNLEDVHPGCPISTNKLKHLWLCRLSAVSWPVKPAERHLKIAFKRKHSFTWLSPFTPDIKRYSSVFCFFVVFFCKWGCMRTYP